MTFDTQPRPKFAALVAACLLSVALPSGAVLAKEKNKTPAPPITVSAPEFSVDIATIDAVGSNVDEATLRAIFSGNIVDNADALASLTADSITIPAITISFSGEMDGKTESGQFSFNNVVLNQVEDGVAASFSLDGMELTSDEAINGNFGAVSAANLDIGGMLGIYGLVQAPEQTELTTLYSDFKAEGGTVDAKDLSCHIGPMEAAEFKGRPLKYSFAELMTMAQALDAKEDDPSPELIGMALHMYADIFTAFQSSPMTFGGFDCKGTDDTGEPIDFSIASMSMDGMAPGVYPAISMDGFRVAVEGGELGIVNITVKATDLSGPIATVQAAPAAIDAAWLEANARALIPAFAGFSIGDASMDIPNPDVSGERIKGSIAAFDLTLANYLNGIPTKLSTTGNKIVVNLPDESSDEQLQQLIDLGIGSLDFGFAIKTAWDETTNAINIEDVSIDGANLARVGLSGTIGNATAALFGIDPDTALAAAMGIVIKNLKVDVLDAGLSDIVLARVSAEQGADATTMRPIYAGLAEGTILGMLAGAAEAQKVGKAVNAFITGDAKALTIEMTAKDPAGLGLADFIAAEDDPTLLIGKTNITATAK